MDQLSILKEMSESQDDGLQVKMDTLLDIVLNICSLIIKQNVNGTSEFALILNDLGVPENQQAELPKKDDFLLLEKNSNGILLLLMIV